MNSLVEYRDDDMFKNNIMLTNDLHDFHPGEDLSIFTYASEPPLLRDINN
ncbi:MAG: hypothetical protein WBL68_01150 [Nitrososphaeraceae archaeon]